MRSVQYYDEGSRRWRSSNRWYQWPILALIVLSAPFAAMALPYILLRALLDWTDERELIAGAERAAAIIAARKEPK